MRPLLDIRFGTEQYPEKVAGRLRTVNIGTRIAAAFHAFFAAVTFAYFTRFWWLGLIHLSRDLSWASPKTRQHRLSPPCPDVQREGTVAIR